MFKLLLIIKLSALPVYMPSGVNAYPDRTALHSLYRECRLDSLLSFEIFRLAMTGFEKIPVIRNKKIITIIDFTKPSVRERFFVIDLENKLVLFRSLVAHGRNSGDNLAVSFSNEDGSLKSCLGFFITGDTYQGRHGYSLKLEGLEPGINDNAASRAIVIHGADYVSTGYADKYGRLGRSWGCPALPLNSSRKIIDMIAGGSCLFIYGNDPEYLKLSGISGE